MHMWRKNQQEAPQKHAFHFNKGAYGAGQGDIVSSGNWVIMSPITSKHVHRTFFSNLTS